MPISVLICANNLSINYGELIPTLTYTISTTDNSFDINNISVDMNISTIISCIATSSSNTGNYDIILNTYAFSANGYDVLFTFQNGTLTINKVNLTIKAENKSKDYDGHIYNDPYTVSYDGFVNNETSFVLNGNLSFNSGTSYNAINVGTYNITPSGYNSTNYNITYSNGILTINKINLNINADNKSMSYTGFVYSGTYTVSYNGFVNNETSSVLSGILSFNSGTSYNAVNTGTYTITPSGLTSNNYNIYYFDGTLTINKLPLTIVRLNNDYTYEYGNMNIIYSNFYSFVGLVNNETVSVITGVPTIYLNNSNIPSKLNVGNYNVTINNIGTLTSLNYSFNNNNIVNTGTIPKLIISKAILTLSPIIPSGTFTYGNTPLAKNLFYTISGYISSSPYLDNSSNVTITNSPSILLNNIEYNQQKLAANTYDIKINSVSNLLSSNYSFAISNPDTLPQFIINKKNVTLTFNNAVSNQPYYGIIDTQSSMYDYNITFSGLISGETSNLFKTINQNSVSLQTISFKKNDNTLLNRTDIPGNYIITIDYSLLASSYTNYNYTLSNTNPITVTVKKGYLTLKPKSPSINLVYTYGDKPNISDLYEVTGFLSNNDNASNICIGIPRIYITRSDIYESGVKTLYTSNTIIDATTHKIDVNSYGLTINSDSNYIQYITDNSIPGIISVNKISLNNANITFTWNSYIPTIAYGNKLTNYQLNAIVPINPYKKTPIGTISYKALNKDTNIIDTTNFYIGNTPNAGTYSLKAIMTVTDPNYIYSTLIANNNNYNTYDFTIVQNYPKITHWNPVPIDKNSQLTSTELSAVSNTNTLIKYYKNDGTELNIGTIIDDDLEIIEKIDDYTNENFYSRYTFRKIKLFTK